MDHALGVHYDFQQFAEFDVQFDIDVFVGEITTVAFELEILFCFDPDENGL